MDTKQSCRIDPATRPNTTAQTSASRRWLTLPTLCLAVLVAQVDTAVVNLATRAIGRDLHVGISVLQWVMDSYNLVYAALLLTGGLLADLYGRRRIFMTGAGLFTAASILCAVAPSAPVLIAGRALAGLGAALLIPASLAIVRVVWADPAERGRALGIWAACNGVAMAIAPTLGGVLINHAGWRSIFWVVIPLSAAACALAIPAMPESSDPQGRHFDALAQCFGAVALGGLAFAAIQSRESPGLAGAALLVAVLAFALFVRVEAGKGAAALVPLDIFRSRTFRGALAATSGMTFGMYGLLFLLPLTWQTTGRFGAVGAGVALMPMALVFIAVSTFSGALVRRYGARVTAAGGVAVIGMGLLLIGASTYQASILATEIGLTMTGIGMGMATGPLMGAAVGAVSAARSGTASAIINVARMAGATIGVALLGALFAMAHGGPGGLRAAMLLGGSVQIACAAAAYGAMRSRPGHS